MLLFQDLRLESSFALFNIEITVRLLGPKFRGRGGGDAEN